MIPFERVRAIALRLPEVEESHQRSPAVLTRLSANDDDDLDELADLIEDAWRRYAPRATVRAFDAAS